MQTTIPTGFTPLPTSAPAPAANNSPLHRPARDNAGNATAPLVAHTQKPDTARTNSIGRDAFDALPADQRDRYAAVRAGPDGGQVYVPRDQLAADTKPEAGAQGDKHKFGDMEFSEQELRDFLTAKGEAELRKASVPATPADYKAELPVNFETPAGVEFKVDETDPLLIDARAWAHSKGMDQAAFSELVGLYASSKAKETAQFNAAHAAEVAKLGANGTQRVSALEQWLRGTVGDKLAGPMRGMMVTADIVKGLETLQQKFSSQGVANFSQSHRTPQEPGGRASDEQYAAMSAAERLNYTRSFDQRQFTEAR